MMNNPFDYTPDEACEAAFKALLAHINLLKQSKRPEDVKFCRELEYGKMLGVLIAKDSIGRAHTLYAFSGQIGDNGFHYSEFVAPVFDYLQPDGYFKTMEADISRQNHNIRKFEEDILDKAKRAYEEAKERLNLEVSEYRERCRRSKSERQSKRSSGNLSEDEVSAMIRESQFEKAELRRIKLRVTAALVPYECALKEAQNRLNLLKTNRRTDSEKLQKWLFSNFTLLNARGESKSLSEIFAETAMKIPPSGAGECCAPKLLQAAFRQGWQPISIAEYWYGKPKRGELRIHGRHYPACRGKCMPVLRWMLQGLDINPPLDSDYGNPNVCEPEIIYENEWFCVLNKPSGMLSVPGKGHAVSVWQWLKNKYPSREVKMAHRLDQDTSGLLIATFGDTSYKLMQSLFAQRKVKKTYVAVLEGDYISKCVPRNGHISLPLSPDWLDRPRQRIDFAEGKEAITDYEFISASSGGSRIFFHPRTGRTHQLRVHAASEFGLAMPIVGDRLYGNSTGNQRLLLHAHRLEFIFPLDGQRYYFDSPVPF